MLQINNEQLKQFYEKCQKDKLIGIDTEFYRVNSYYPKLCLIQLSNTSESIFLDPINEEINFDYIKKVLFNTKIKKILHAARQDIEIFYNIYKKIPRPLIDTQICLLALGYPHSTSYAKACSDFLNVKINKANQFIDWRSRPLSKDRVLYAINDVKYLIPLYKKINKKLKLKKKESFLKSSHRKISNINIYSERIDRAWERLKFRTNSKKELNDLKRFSKIREKIAMQKDVPVKRIITDSEIKLICRIKVKKDVKKRILKKLHRND